ncbi:hypothetical protein H5410_046783 [Solanum commersonii]|uniref:Uncharacterized protein n=1 Tax=Solanum commersonii TaxID=4109 RepID=A0A9J5XF92_SOLCO|nr:hypothetical protein H5410_046783 [Solanum commersonii]
MKHQSQTYGQDQGLNLHLGRNLNGWEMTFIARFHEIILIRRGERNGEFTCNKQDGLEDDLENKNFIQGELFHMAFGKGVGQINYDKCSSARGGLSGRNRENHRSSKMLE